MSRVPSLPDDLLVSSGTALCVHIAPSTTTFLTPPRGWTDDEDFFLETPWFSVTRVMAEMCYDLHDAKPIWAEEVLYYTSFVLFEASPGTTKKKRYYAWEAWTYTLYRFEEESLEQIRDSINHGAKNAQWGAIDVPLPSM